MLIYGFLESMLWFLKLCYVSPRLLYIVPLLLLIIRGGWIKVSALMYGITLVYGMIKSSAVGLIRYLHSASSPLYGGSHLWETITNFTIYLSSMENQSMGGVPFFPSPFSFSPVTTVFENFEKLEYSWGVGTSTVLALLLGISILLNAVQLSFKVKQLFKKISRRCAPRLDNDEWQGAWGSMGRYLEKWAPPMFWKFTPEQVRDPEEVVKYLEEACCHPGSSREIQIAATCWDLARADRAPFDTPRDPQGEEKVSGPHKETMSAAATQTSTQAFFIAALDPRGIVPPRVRTTASAQTGAIE
ncbi:uncharacterized protein LOC126037250 [Accipiter gentilis]|uniref:uncharacterized protein LOC126037250 n=1 Tax=Astur gentilis TaxID=8957 RepID=UPI00210F9258|nr:uncharacterized protein LOC126037250 [Accipiter gentilis]